MNRLRTEWAFQNTGGFHNFSNQGSDFDETYFNQQRESDQDFINNFVSNRLQKEKNTDQKLIKISEAKSLLVEIINEKKKIESQVLSLDVSDEDFNVKWKTLELELNEVNEKIFTFELNVKNPLLVVLNKRLKKRKAIKKRRDNFKAFKVLKQKEIQKKHELIDKLLKERSEEVEAVKYEAALKRQADSVLHEVRKKKYEAKKMLQLLTALAKLRDLRSKEEEKLGGFCSKQLTETFNKVMTRFQKLWQNQLEVYKLEEKGLKIMLEENTVPQPKTSKFETNILQWEKVLFGDIADNEIEKFLSMPNTDIQALIQVRRDWDQFLTTESTPMATSIPVGWVLPPETKDEQWKAFTKSSKNFLH